MSLPTLSPKQAEVLSFIETTLGQEGRPPSLREIAAHCAKSGAPLAIGTIQDHIRALLTKGYLQRDAGRARGLRLTHQAAAVSIPILGSVPAGHPLEAIADSQGSLAWSQPPARAGRGGGKNAGAAAGAGSADASGRGGSSGGERFALRVRGDSMQDAGILDGDFVVVERASNARHGEIVVALIDGEATVKRLERKGSRLRLLPENPRFAPIELDPSRENLIQGRVVGVQRFL